MNWTTIDAYLDAPSLLDIAYARTLFDSCAVSRTGAYVWLAFCDECGIDDPGDYANDATYPDRRP